jgi:hypothetical protein
MLEGGDGEESALLALRAQVGFVRGNAMGFGCLGEGGMLARAVFVTQEEADAL